MVAHDPDAGRDAVRRFWSHPWFLDYWREDAFQALNNGLTCGYRVNRPAADVWFAALHEYIRRDAELKTSIGFGAILALLVR